MEDVEKLTQLLNLVRLNPGDVLWQSSVETKV
jgi:hypothetical protein